jgi:hypothetical protein
MTLLAPNAFAGNDNLLYATAPLLDFPGVSYAVGGVDYNLQYDLASQAPFGPGYGEFAATGQFVQVNFVVSPVPEPSSLLLMASGLIAISIGLRRRRSTIVAP